jgi:hypothetical protein
MPDVLPIVKPQVLGSTIKLSCNGKNCGVILLDRQMKLMRGSVRPLTGKFLKTGLTKKALDLVILTVLRRFAYDDHYFGNFAFEGNEWYFAELEYESMQAA